MPRIRRHFPVDQDINSDPNICLLCDKFGVAGLRIWLELQSISDRNDGQVPGDYQELMRPLSGKCQTTNRRVIEVLEFLNSRLMIASQSPVRVLNYADFHNTWERNKIPSGKVSSSSLTLPNHTIPNIETTSLVLPHETPPVRVLRKPAGAGIPNTGEWPSIEAFVSLYNEQTPDECPAVQPPLSENRQKKARLYLKQFPEQAYWEEVFQQIHASQFLRGLRPSNGHGNFRADFDWLLSKGKDGSENFVKVHDGRYHN